MNDFIMGKTGLGTAAALTAMLTIQSCAKPGGPAVDDKMDLTPVEFSINDVYGELVSDSIVNKISEKIYKAHASHNYIDEVEQMNNLFWLYYNNRVFDKALLYAKDINTIGDSVNNPFIQGRALHDLALVSSEMKNPSISDRNFTYTIEKYGMLKDTLNMVRVFSNWGECNYKAQLFDSADSFLRRAHGLAMKNDYKIEKARTTAQLAMLAITKYGSDLAANNVDYIAESEKYLEIAKLINDDFPNPKTENIINLVQVKINYYKSLSENNLAKRKNYQDLILEAIYKAGDYARMINDHTTQQELAKIEAQVLLNQGKILQAKSLSDSIENIVCKQDPTYKNLETLYFIKSRIAIAEGNYKESTQYIEKAFVYNNSTPIEDKSLAKSLQLAKFLNTGERERAKGRENALKAQARMRNLIMTTIGVILIAVLVTSVVIFRSLRRSKRLNKTISAQNEEIQAINEKVTKINKEITGSINYAKLIQKAILPSEEKMNQIFGDHLCILKAKDIVSGDFYWAYETARQKLIAVCDCTGHGVPGAMLSMLGTNILEHATRRISFQPKTAAEILDACRIEFKKMLNQTHYTSKGAKDSIDMALFVYNKPTHTLDFAGAMRPMWIIRNGEVIKTKNDPMPIGVYPIEKDHFTNHSIKLEENDYIYMFSDGIQDQFGWCKERPMAISFSSKRFTNMLLANYQLPFDEQKQNIEKELADWKKGKQENQEECQQTDDNVLIGLRVSNFY